MYHCVGCGATIPWDGVSSFSYTCPCRATIFICDSNDMPSFSSSMLISMIRRETVRLHLDDLVGVSDYTSAEKTTMIDRLSRFGCTWMKDCPQCLRDGTLTEHEGRRKMEVALQRVRNRAATGELTIKESIAERLAIQKRHS